jgi:antitoxin component YwqK of YwqJK toxin-antitoxin module
MYWESGGIWRVKNYVDGKEQGRRVYYDEDGNITDEDIIKDGVCDEMCEYTDGSG